MYGYISITTKYGSFSHNKCDYYIQDNMLTVFRKELIEPNYVNQTTYYPFEAHYPMENVIEIECVKK